MSAVWPSVPIGDLLRRSERTIAIDAETTYREVTVRLNGKGVVERRQVQGVEIASDRRYEASAGQFIISRIDARNGASGLVPDCLAGAVVTNDFPLFDVDRERLDPRFLSWMSKTAPFVDLCKRASEGTTNRVRLSEERFKAFTISLPPLDEQRRIVARIETLAAKVAEALETRKNTANDLTHLVDAASVRVFVTDPVARVRDYVRFQTGYAFKSEWFVPEGIRVARNANVSHGTLDWSDAVMVPESVRSQFARFELETGDILVSLDRPLISTGAKVARVREDDLPCLLLQRVARAFFVSDELEPEYFYRWLRSSVFARAIDPGRSNGVPHISHKDIEAIPFAVPDRKEQRRAVVALDALQAKVDAVKTLQVDTAAELDALLPSILDKAFKGEL